MFLGGTIRSVYVDLPMALEKTYHSTIVLLKSRVSRTSLDPANSMKFGVIWGSTNKNYCLESRKSSKFSIISTMEMTRIEANRIAR